MEAMRIIDDLLSIIDHGAAVEEVRQGPFQTAVLTRYCGLASTPHGSGPHQFKSQVMNAGLLTEETAGDIASLAKSNSLYEAAIGMATINSLLDIKYDDCQDLNARDLIMQKGAGKKVAVVGHFPFITQVRGVAKELWVIEKNPQIGDYTEDEAYNILPQADIVAITGTAFTNHTIEQLLDICSPKSYVIVLGDTTPLSGLLFDYHIDALSGTRVIDNKLVLKYVSEGATYRQIKGIRKLTMAKT